VAVKVQYPGAREALLSDLRQIARLGRTVAPLVPGVDIKPLIEEMQARAVDELDYALEAEAQRAFAQAFADDPEIVVPDVVAHGDTVLVTEWLESPASLAGTIREGTQEERDHYGELLVRFLFAGPGRTGMLHADPHPGNFRVLPNDDGSPGKLGILDYGAVARLPSKGLPEAMGRLIRIAAIEDRESLEQGLRDEGFIKDRTRVDPDLLLDYLGPFVEPTKVERFRFSREWMRTQFNRINNPREPAYTVAMKLNLPPTYLLIHRTWLGGVGVLSQLEAEAPFRAILTEYLPGFAAA
jgi:predicted unusual protein kinase regulating ubiquinone biosynthesis (AarF/ABC1/UbiB family)